MAIKGCARQMVVLNCTGGSIFEKAYFIVKADASDTGESDMLREANRIIEENGFRRHRRTRLWRWLFFVAGVALGILLAIGVWALFGLLC